MRNPTRRRRWQCLDPLRARTEAPTILRGFMFFYGAALGVKLGLADAADDADKIIAAFAVRLQDAVDPEAARADLLSTIGGALEPVHASVWVKQPTTLP